MGIFFLLDVSSQLFNKLMIITSYNMIKMGGVIQGEITRVVLRISGVINYFYLLKVSKCAKIRNRYNQVPHLTQDTNGKVTNSQ